MGFYRSTRRKSTKAYQINSGISKAGIRQTGWAMLLLVLLLSSCFSNNRNQGQRLYAKSCAGCHGEHGEGLEKLIPPLAQADYLKEHRADLPCLLRHGMNYAIKVNGVKYQNVMPGTDSLSPARMTNLLNYLENQWGNKAPLRTIHEVDEQLRACP